jgi:cytochrome oxidase Cu insertion factor (SCO1/SenC/PrrC family)|tara:strand:+ start:663 stop:950 length:288 start_codon:yes stop_codon:yes gene_type:complete
MRRQFAFALLAAGIVTVGGCGDGNEAMDQAAMDEMQEIVLGPAGGHELSPSDIDRVSAGQVAPDFSATSLEGPVVTLSQFRGNKNVVLFFYRGHW